MSGNEINDLRLAEIEARAEAATPGPWFWDVNSNHKGVTLEQHRYVVMSFDRWGMNSAVPCFRSNEGRMIRADKLAKSIPGKEHHEGFDDYIDHPDALFIAHSHEDIKWLLSEVKRLRALLVEVEK